MIDHDAYKAHLLAGHGPFALNGEHAEATIHDAVEAYQEIVAEYRAALRGATHERHVIERWECPEHGFDDATFGALNPPRCGCGHEFVWTRYERTTPTR